MTTDAKKAGELILAQKPGFRPQIGLVLGSGLGKLADHLEDALVIPYANLPGFPRSSVAGHQGNVVIGTLCGVPVACLQGRVHYYEGIDYTSMKTLIRTLKVLGCDTMLATNAVGSMRPEVGAGALVVIRDHINLQGHSPLIGPNDDDFGPRFTGMDAAYDPALREQLHAAGKAVGVEMTEGVYAGVLGPSFETPAEIKAIRSLGGDVVGMSTVPDVIIARHCGMRVAAISVVTNMAAGMSDELLTHDGTLAAANAASDTLINLIMHFVAHTWTPTAN